MATPSISFFDHEFQNASETTLRFRVIVISKVDRYNSIDGRSFKQLATLCDEANGNCDALVLCSDPRSPYFTAGADVAAADEPPKSPDQAGAYQLTAALAQLRVPVVAVVHGPAIGAGLTLMLLADLVYASARASFRAPFRELAIVPELGSSMLLPAAIGHQRSFQLLFCGRCISAETAQAWGLVTEVIPAEVPAKHCLGVALEQLERMFAAPHASKSAMLCKALLRSGGVSRRSAGDDSTTRIPESPAGEASKAAGADAVNGVWSSRVQEVARAEMGCLLARLDSGESMEAAAWSAAQRAATRKQVSFRAIQERSGAGTARPLHSRAKL